MQSQDTARLTLLQNAISHWKEYKDNTLKHWKQSIIIDTKSNHLHLKRTLKYWHEWSTQQYHNKNTIKYKNTINAMKTIKIRHCIKYWHYCIQSIYELQKQSIKASAYYNMKQQRQCISKWKQLAHKKTILKSKLYQFRAEINGKIIKNCFNLWKKEQILQNTALKVTILLNNYADRLYLIQSFDHWFSQYLHININKETAAQFHESQIKKKILIAFQRNMKHNKRCQDKLNQIVSFRSNPDNVNKNELEIAYISWKYKTKQIKLIKNNIHDEIKRDVLLLLQRNTIKQQRLKYFEEKIKRKHNMLAIQRIFNEWKWNICVNQQSESFLLSNCLQFWYELMRKHNSNNAKYNMLKQWIGIKTLNNLWLYWYLTTLYNIELNDKNDIAVNFYKHKSKSLLFYKWKKFVINHKRQKKLTKKLQNNYKKSMKKRAFNHWYLLYFEHQYQNEANQIAMRYLIKKYMKCWNTKMKLRKHKRFNNYKAKLFNTKSYFNKWLIIFEPFKIGFEYEKQITMSIKPYIDSIRNKNILFDKFRIWYISTITKQHKKEKRIREHKAKQFRNKQIKHKTFRKWRIFVDENKNIYCWNKGILLRVIDNILEDKCKENKINETLNSIELALKDLLDQKLEFKQKCKQFIKLKQLQCSEVKKCKLEIEITNYLQHKQERKNQISIILSDISSLYKYFQQNQYIG